jgi:AraC family transcriptional regulator of adaptative response / methylphosphotriester-DNA alkyltransferase methyltransferase
LLSGCKKETAVFESDDKKWDAVVRCDQSADGEFFYAVKTVGVYCRPSCKSRTPLRKNVLFFKSAAEAKQAGFRPCKRCRPDLLDYAPALEIAERTKRLIDGYWDSRKQIDREMRELGVSASQLSRIFRAAYGMTPGEYLSQVRVRHAKQMLQDEANAIIDVAYEVGFESLSAFYRFFKKHAGVTPREYRLDLSQKESQTYDHEDKRIQDCHR